MTTMLRKILQLSLTVLLQMLVVSASKWDLKMSLRDLISGHCHVVTPRVCRKFTGFDSDFTCGFILRHVCTNAYTGEQSLKMLTETDGNVHITPLPRSLSFYDVNEDGHISLIEFARTLGHSPRDLHVKVAFRAADKNGDGAVSLREFKTTDAWVFEARYVDIKPHALHQNHHGNLKRKISRPIPHNIHAIKAYTDSDEDVSDEHDISLEHMDSHESFEDDHDDFFDDSEEMYEDMESLEENNHKAHNRHFPVSGQADDSRESSHEVDSREMEDNSRDVDDKSWEMDENSHEMEGNSHEIERNSHEIERNSHERNSHEIERNSHEIEGNSLEMEENSHEVEDNSHEKEVNSHSVEKTSHKVDVDSHEIEFDSHEMESMEEEKDSREDLQDSHERDDVSKEIKRFPIHHGVSPGKLDSREDSKESRDSVEYEDSEEWAEFDEYEDSKEKAEHHDSKENEYEDSEEEAEYNDSIEVKPSREVSDEINSLSEEYYDEDSRESREDESPKMLKKPQVVKKKTIKKTKTLRPKRP